MRLARQPVEDRAVGTVVAVAAPHEVGEGAPERLKLGDQVGEIAQLRAWLEKNKR